MNWRSAVQCFAVTCIVFFGFSSMAYADPLRILLQSGAGTGVIITDNNPGDTNPALGAINFVGDIGGRMTLNLSATQSGNVLEVSSSNTTYTGALGGSVSVFVQAPGVTFGPTGSLSFIGSAAGILPTGSIATLQTFVNPNNALAFNAGDTGTAPAPIFAPVIPVGSIGAFSGVGATLGPGAFSTTNNTGVFTNTAPYSMITVVTINFAQTGTATYGVSSVVSPEPTSLLLLATGLIGVGILGRRVRK